MERDEQDDQFSFSHGNDSCNNGGRPEADLAICHSLLAVGRGRNGNVR
jgi:hypothetical protein